MKWYIKFYNPILSFSHHSGNLIRIYDDETNKILFTDHQIDDMDVYIRMNRGTWVTQNCSFEVLTKEEAFLELL